MKFIVNIDYRKGPSFSCEIEAQNRASAGAMAVSRSEAMGWNCNVKRIKITESAVPA